MQFIFKIPTNVQNSLSEFNVTPPFRKWVPTPIIVNKDQQPENMTEETPNFIQKTIQDNVMTLQEKISHLWENKPRSLRRKIRRTVKRTSEDKPRAEKSKKKNRVTGHPSSIFNTPEDKPEDQTKVIPHHTASQTIPHGKPKDIPHGKPWGQFTAQGTQFWHVIIRARFDINTGTQSGNR